MLVHQRVPKNRWSRMEINGKSLVKMDDLGVPHDLGVTPISPSVKLCQVVSHKHVRKMWGKMWIVSWISPNQPGFLHFHQFPTHCSGYFHVASRVLRRCQMQIPWHLHQGIFLFGPGQKVVEGLAAGDVIRVPVQPEGHHPIPGNWWNMLGTSEVTTSEASRIYL